MKIVLSRKGFDSASGRVPSPILPDGTLVPLPIPSHARGAIPYAKLRVQGCSLAQLVQDVTGGKYTARDRAHVDPDLRKGTLANRPQGWRPLFGPGRNAQAHLAGEHVGREGLFLFFGWFRRVELRGGHYSFVRGAPDQHVLFGWLQIGAVLSAGPSARAAAPSWARYHTHFHNNWPSNTVYLARRSLKLPGLTRRLPGGGVSERFSTDLLLTAPGESRSIWRLPRFFRPIKSKSIMSYHRHARWTVRPDCCYLKSVGRGQEFVVDANLCQQAVSWAEKLVENNG